jgi:molybdopterin-guanine dinucleotide biosynthesis protein A
MRGAGLAVAVVAKPDTPLPDVGDDVVIWREPGTLHHPLVGIAHALRVCDSPIVVCAGDMPFVPSAVIALLAGCVGDVTVTASERALQPLLGMYTPAVLDVIDTAIADESSMRTFVAALGDRAQTIGPDRLRAFGDPEMFMRDIDTPHDLQRANAMPRHPQHDTH